MTATQDHNHGHDRAVPLVLATEWNVSTTSPSGYDSENRPLPTIRLSVFKIQPSEPSYEVINHPVHNGLLFNNYEESDAYCLKNGLLMEYKPGNPRT